MVMLSLLWYFKGLMKTWFRDIPNSDEVKWQRANIMPDFYTVASHSQTFDCQHVWSKMLSYQHQTAMNTVIYSIFV